ncbi:phage tail tape measure protein [Streptomyces sp. C8S0]|uniref:phage tail tape measure protein n=1 Tax=Streptomyces sp. C8S0 TaxID=2585716 RepID=UPI001D03F3CE|nr:phage tail tape measure protein [Streptomyces sp. C8S0]
MAKAGIKVADITGGALKGALNLAAAAQIDLSEAAEISATTMTVFGLKGKDVGHIADVLAAAANKSATDVHQLGLSFKMTAQVAAMTGLTLEDTTGAMALFASEGLKGSDAGTSFKVMLQRLTPQSKEAQATMDRLGFSAYDANGNFVGLEEVAQRMKTAFSGLTPEARNAAMGVIFGSDAVRAAGILYKHGAEGVRTYTDAVDDQGYAAAVAQTKMNHLLGDLQLLQSALEGR